MSQIKNYNNCPLKKRPVHVVKEEEEAVDYVCYDQYDREQEEPVNLCIKKIKLEKDIVHDLRVPTKSSYPLKDITVVTQQKILPNNNNSLPYSYDDNKPIELVHPEYNYVPDYRYEEYEYHQSANHSYSPNSQQSLSPPPQYDGSRSSYISSSPPTVDGYSYSNRYMPYIPAEHHHQHHENETEAYHDYHHHHHHSLSPTHTSLNSLGSPTRSSISPASTGSVSVDELYSSNKLAPIQKTYETPAEPIKYLIKEKELPRDSTPHRYQCSQCGKSYSTYSGLSKHTQFHCPSIDGNQSKKTYECEFCEKVYTSSGALKMHIKTHTLPCKCHICGKAFSRPWLLQGHIRTHTGEKPFSCQYCHRAFADRSNLRAHLQTHSDIKKYMCGTCNKTFSRMSLLSKHTDNGCPGLHHHHTTNPAMYVQ